jgi:aspartate/methionine/tyrosine aminotransferase
MKKNFVPFMLEREMGIWEHQVKYNLSESGVHPMSTSELLGHDPKLIEEFLSTELNYPQTNGSVELRERIAATYPGAAADDVLVTTGAAQANFTSILTALDPGDEILVMVPNYMQIWGAAKNLGVKVNTFSLKEELGWGFDIDEFRKLVSQETRLIAICNPNNPTGHIMTEEELNAVITAAAEVGAWILSDEVYAGAEHNTDEVTPSIWGQYDRVLAIGSLSKAYALPGLRLGWVVSNPRMAEAIWSRQDYITICPTILANKLGAHALSPEVRPQIIQRTRKYVRKGYSNLQNWVSEHEDTLRLIQPGAAAIGFVHYDREINSSELVKHLIDEEKTYVVPGDHFGMDHYLRISYGLSDEYVNEGLRRIYKTIASSV